MKCKIISTIFFFVFFLSSGIAQAGMEEKIIGRWYERASDTSIEFTEGGKAVTISRNPYKVFRYEDDYYFVSENKIIKEPISSVPETKREIRSIIIISISKDSMKISYTHEDGNVRDYIREKNIQAIDIVGQWQSEETFITFLPNGRMRAENSKVFREGKKWSYTIINGSKIFIRNPDTFMGFEIILKEKKLTLKHVNKEGKEILFEYQKVE